MSTTTANAQLFGVHGGLEYQIFQGEGAKTQNSFRPSFGPFVAVPLHSQIIWRTELAISPSGSPYLRKRTASNPISAGIAIPTMIRFYPRPNFMVMGGIYYEYWMTHTAASELVGHSNSVSFMNVGPLLGIGIRKNKWDFNIRADWDAYPLTSPDPVHTGQAMSVKLICGLLLRAKDRKFVKRRLWIKSYIPGKG